MAQLEGRIALVTGAASGLGAAIATRFHAAGAHVIVADIDETGSLAMCADLGSRAQAVRLDVTDEDNWRQVIAGVRARHGRLDVLVNNAGITTIGDIEHADIADLRKMIDIDLVGVFMGCKHGLSLMKETGGSIINMASMSANKASSYLPGYNAAKAGVVMLTKSAALYCGEKGYGVRCNTIHPGVIRTPILDKVLEQAEDPDAMFAEWVAGHPIGRIGKPEEIAAMALFLASDASAFATGAEFIVDGGSSL